MCMNSTCIYDKLCAYVFCVIVVCGVVGFFVSSLCVFCLFGSFFVVCLVWCFLVFVGLFIYLFFKPLPKY